MPSRSPLWTPSPQRAQASQMHQFLRLMADKHGVAPEWEALRTWAIDRRDLFWSEFLEFAQILPSVPAERPVAGEGMLDTQWFPGMKLNYARHLLRFDDDQDAVIALDELGHVDGTENSGGRSGKKHSHGLLARRGIFHHAAVGQWLVGRWRRDCCPADSHPRHVRFRSGLECFPTCGRCHQLPLRRF